MTLTLLLVFQSTRPARGATCAPTCTCRRLISFNPRAPHGARRPTLCASPPAKCGFNPRAPHGARPSFSSIDINSLPFQSTRPARGATLVGAAALSGIDVSIHAPRTGRDGRWSGRSQQSCRFNPRAPHGARRPAACRPALRCRFQSTRPARGATLNIPRARLGDPVSIHAPRTGRDMLRRWPGRSQSCFNPRAPHGARQPGDGHQKTRPLVSIHAPRTGRDQSQSIL